MSFNFANPWWLVGLFLIPLGFFLRLLQQKNVWHASIYKFIDKELLPHLLLSTPNKSSKPRLTGLLYAAFVFCVVIALANPRWSYKDIDAFQPTASMVIVLDLNSYMNATDVSPTRIARARQYIEDLVNLSRGLKIGIIGFAARAHLISPITDDLQTIKTYVPALDTDLTSHQGNSLENAFKMAEELLAAEPGQKKSVLLISSGDFANATQLHFSNTGITLHVVGVGTTTGAPYKNHGGGR